MTVSAPALRQRDPRLDFFRGLGMFIIFIAHVPWNWLTLWIPARFGFSDATEIFVFCSGMASALAFGKVFDERGWGMGVARVAHRMWQVYWAHIGQILLLVAGLVALQESGYLQRCCGLTEDYVASLNMRLLFERTGEALPGLFTLTWVPNYFDILPMYIVILALLPAVMLAAKAGRGAVFALCGGLWLLASLGHLSLPAEPWSDRPWFFNPFAWQLVFFTGFAFMRGWIPAPPVDRRLVALAVAVVVASVPFAYFRILDGSPALMALRTAIEPLWIKTEFGLLRYVHFLALAYLAWAAAGERGRRLVGHGRLWDGFVRVVQKVGQQSLAVFLASLVLAQTVAILRDMVWGRGEVWPQILSNLGGFAGLIAVAYTVAWFKSSPWKRPASARDLLPAGTKTTRAGPAVGARSGLTGVPASPER
ncbi:OpgC family protein [Polymorphum gilvum]|uniref:Membrane protein, putative n=1 Tax=Polymorphum gilvum (strain LMG 25793 / CGMCC 1.9160 / SL003B-26A1) TaxID=991905 RepID=F2J6V6_POLGS|nr:OpgC domain-containing protein [Polymorphum gilvum]ADZ72589.1 Membrane protein, putative [Polymorphum gilvum SL003B-26A1]